MAEPQVKKAQCGCTVGDVHEYACGLVGHVDPPRRQAENDDTLWTVTKKGVYDHGVCYVGLTEADAQQFTQDYAPDDDGYHEWRIDRIKVGVPTGDTTVRRVSSSEQGVTR